MNLRNLCISSMMSCALAGVVSAGTLTVSAVVPVGNSPQEAVVTPNGAEVDVTNYADNTVSVIDTATGAVSP